MFTINIRIDENIEDGNKIFLEHNVVAMNSKDYVILLYRIFPFNEALQEVKKYTIKKLLKRIDFVFNEEKS